jgi:hypothetical protein
MSTRENEGRKNSLKFDSKAITLAVNMIKQLEKTIEVVYYLMEHEDVESFVLILLSAKNIDVDKLLKNEKRNTDLLFEIDKKESIYVMVCQDTKVDGGYHFAERIIKNIHSNDGIDVYCSEIEVRSTQHEVKSIIFKLIETYMKSKVDNKINEIVYKSLN